MEGRRWSDIQRLQNDTYSLCRRYSQKIGTGGATAAMYTATGPYAGPLQNQLFLALIFRAYGLIPLETNNNQHY
jgi:hypothetical protein